MGPTELTALRNLTTFSILTLTLSGCDAGPPGLLSPLPERRRQVYELAGSGFERVDLVFPMPDASRSEVNLAPLIVEEIRGDGDPSDHAETQVEFRRQEVTLAGRTRSQICYRWHLPAAEAANAPHAQGVRLTLDASGHPAIIELLARQNGLRVIYVSESLENTARTAHGPPLPGRKHAIERGVEEQPTVVVARALPESAAPLGPFVYLESGTRRVVTMLCRCEPSRLSDARGTRSYSLQETVEAFPDEDRMLDAAADPRWLERALRLPSDF